MSGHRPIFRKSKTNINEKTNTKAKGVKRDRDSGKKRDKIQIETKSKNTKTEAPEEESKKISNVETEGIETPVNIDSIINEEKNEIVKTQEENKEEEEKIINNSRKHKSIKNQANDLFRKRDFEHANILYSKALNEDDKNAALFSNRSASLIGLQRYSEALIDAETAIKLHPGFSQGYFRQGCAFIGLEKYNAALNAFQNGLECDAKNNNIENALSQTAKIIQDIHDYNAENHEKLEIETVYYLQQWLRQENSRFPFISVRQMDNHSNERGVYSITSFTPGSLVCQIPYCRLITSDLAKASVLGRLLQSTIDLRSNQTYLASFLLSEKRKQHSIFQPFFKILPSSFLTFPLAFNTDELSYLKGSFVHEKVKEQKDSIKKEYDNIRMGIPQFEKYSLEEFVWSRLVVSSRIFNLQINGVKTEALIPLIDMFNHSDGETANCTWFAHDHLQSVIVVATKNIPRNTELKFCYGNKCNSKLFLNYGFTLNNNNHNRARVKLNLPDNDPYHLYKLKYLGGSDKSASRIFIVHSSYEYKDLVSTLSFLRFAHAKDREIQILSSIQQFDINTLPPLSVTNEKNVLKSLAAAAIFSLKIFSGGIPADELELNRSISQNVKYCIYQRMGEKKVLHDLLELQNIATHYLSIDYSAAILQLESVRFPLVGDYRINTAELKENNEEVLDNKAIKQIYSDINILMKHRVYLQEVVIPLLKEQSDSII